MREPSPHPLGDYCPPRQHSFDACWFSGLLDRGRCRYRHGLMGPPLREKGGDRSRRPQHEVLLVLPQGDPYRCRGLRLLRTQAGAPQETIDAQSRRVPPPTKTGPRVASSIIVFLRSDLFRTAARLTEFTFSICS